MYTVVGVNARHEIPTLGPAVPQRGNWFSRTGARLLWARTGWRFEHNLPDVSKAVVIVAPHTSNWDFLIGVIAMFAVGVRVSFLAKHTLFWWPLGPVMRWLGGIAIDRRSSSGVVVQIVDELRDRERLLLVVAPEGTRGSVDKWRTGFYHIAHGAGVPIVPISFDYGRRLIRFGDPFDVSEDMESDLTLLRAFFDEVSGKRDT